MADETTPLLGLVKPEVNGPQTENVWGYDINANFDKIDERFGLTLYEAPLDGDIYGRRQGAWSRTVLQTDFEALVDRVDGNDARDDAQDTVIAGKADATHTHIAADITDFAEATDDRVYGLLTAGPNITIQYDDTLNKLQISSTGTGSGGGGGGTVANGDYGDIIVSGFGTTWAIDTGVVTYPKIQNVAADKLLGAVTAGTVQEIDCTAAGRALLDDATAAAQRATLGLSNAATADLATLQPADPTLTALAGLSAGAGLVEQTGPDAFTKRAMGISASTSIPTFGDTETRYQPRDQTLVALANLDGTPGLLEQTALDFFAKRPTGTAAPTNVLTRADGDSRYAQLDSPVFTGDARAVTPAASDNDTSIATTAFVKNVAVNKTGDVMSGSLTVQGNFATNQINCTNLYPSGSIQMPISGPIYMYNHGASSAAYIQAEAASGDMLFVTGTSGLGVRFRIGGNGNASFGAQVNANIFQANAVNSAGNMSTAGTHYAGAFSAPSATITNINCTNIAAGNNMTCNNGDVAGQWRAGSVYSYGNLRGNDGDIAGQQRVGDLVSHGNVYAYGASGSSGVGTFGGVTANGDINCSNACFIAGPCYSAIFVTWSDERLKENLQPIADPGAIIDATEVWSFDWKKSGRHDYGVMAQHAITVLPEAVVHDEVKDTWGVDYTRWVPILIAEVQHLRVKVDQLHARIKDLEEASG